MAKYGSNAVTITAQRRPERQPRLHTAHGRYTPHWSSTLNEGRSVNPGYTARDAVLPVVILGRSTKAGASTPATPHDSPAVAHQPRRSTKAGASTPATLVVHDAVDGERLRSTKAGASTPATPLVRRDHHRFSRDRSTKAGASTPATHGAWHDGGLHMGRSTKAGASTPATHLDPRRLAPVSSRSTKAGASTPATQGSGAQACRRRLRSTKAGASTPATLDTMSCSDFGFMNAQRRPERQPRLHC